MYILSIGEVLWDMLPSGPKVGGAPANFAFHCKQLGAEVRLVSRVGDDRLGHELLDFYRNIGIPTELIGVDATAPTGTVDVEILSDGQPKYTIRENVAWDHIEASPAAVQFATTADAVCFGSLASRTPETLASVRTLVEAAPESALRILDLNLRDPFTEKPLVESVLGLANILKLNDDELFRIAAMFGSPGRSLEEHAEWFVRQRNLRWLILTCGSNGSCLFAADGQKNDSPGRQVAVVDTIGAGDAFTATAVVGLLFGLPLAKINERANDVAAFVCSQSGATPKLPDEFRSMS